MLRAEPPLPGDFLVRRSPQRLLCHLPRETRSSRVQRHHLAGPVGQYKQIAAPVPPQIGGGILNCGFILRGHERSQRGQVGEQFRQSR